MHEGCSCIHVMRTETAAVSNMHAAWQSAGAAHRAAHWLCERGIYCARRIHADRCSERGGPGDHPASAGAFTHAPRSCASGRHLHINNTLDTLRQPGASRARAADMRARTLARRLHPLQESLPWEQPACSAGSTARTPNAAHGCCGPTCSSRSRMSTPLSCGRFAAQHPLGVGGMCPALYKMCMRSPGRPGRAARRPRRSGAHDHRGAASAAARPRPSLQEPGMPLQFCLHAVALHAARFRQKLCAHGKRACALIDADGAGRAA